jgi:hypothetical protein
MTFMASRARYRNGTAPEPRVQRIKGTHQMRAIPLRRRRLWPRPHLLEARLGEDPSIVRLGPAEWGRFARKRDTDRFELLSSVRQGASMGALAVTPEGRYLQVNGDHVSSLNMNELRRAVQSAKAQMRGRCLRTGPLRKRLLWW